MTTTSPPDRFELASPELLSPLEDQNLGHSLGNRTYSTNIQVISNLPEGLEVVMSFFFFILIISCSTRIN